MAASKQDIRRWFEDGLRNKATHFVVVYDSFDYEDYPKYVFPGESVFDVVQTLSNSGEKVMEVYDLSMDIENQLNEKRVFNY